MPMPIPVARLLLAVLPAGTTTDDLLLPLDDDELDGRLDLDLEVVISAVTLPFTFVLALALV
jgi:hypothetical protein